MSAPVVEIRDAVVAYRSGVALDGVSLTVNAGEAVGILGPNGTGKSTLLMLVNGLVRPQSGAVRVLGGEPFRAMQGYRLRRRIGYLAQTQRIDPRLPVTVRETVAAGRYGRIGLLRRMGRADRRAVAEAMDR
ncbi:MAG TPA: ATP-binding cassette domain-containing protein, partial [Candidatus Hydrogenedentes bacterium]|nr:ATP-binding cassette domain-containing protein [Candidatus Hydrogenedentota bacterium]